MSRLYLRIFLAFWLVIALVVSGVWLVNSQLVRLADDEQFERLRLGTLRRDLAAELEATLAAGDRPAMRRRLEQLDREHPRVRLLLVDDDGHELLDRPLPPRLEWRAERQQRRQELRERRDDRAGPGRGPVSALVRVQGQDYLLVLQRAPEPLLLRVLGPIGPVGLVILALLISGVICFFLARTITRPVRHLQTVGQRLGDGDLDTRAAAAFTARRDELGDLARDFNRMAERIALLVQNQSRLLRDVSHELRSPLARLQVALALAVDAADDASRARQLARIEQEIERLNDLIGEILDYSRLNGGERAVTEPVDLADVLRVIAEAAGLEGEPRRVTVALNADTLPALDGEAALLHRAIENVVRNALRHSPNGGTVQIAATSNGAVEICVADDGPGVPEDRLDAIFEPFVRLSPARDEAGAGGGVGLAIARAAVRRHGGNIHAENRAGGGLAVRIRLPRSAAP